MSRYITQVEGFLFYFSQERGLVLRVDDYSVKPPGKHRTAQYFTGRAYTEEKSREHTGTGCSRKRLVVL